MPTPGNDHQGTHFLVYQLDEELHSFRWLNPEVFGSCNHVWQACQVDGTQTVHPDPSDPGLILDRDNAPGTFAKG